jgi:hypothetical protein
MNQVCRFDPTTCTGATQYNGTYPPDTSLARSSERVIEVVNSRARLFDSVGGVFQTKTLNTFQGAVDVNGDPAGSVLFDPHVMYDRNSSRFFAVALAGGHSADQSRLYLAVSRSANPSSLVGSSWCRYYIDTNISYAGTNTWADFPSLGVGARGLVVTTNQFAVGGSEPFKGAALWAWDKLDLTDNALSCPSLPEPFAWFSYNTSTGSSRLPFTMSVAQHNTLPTSFTNARQPTYLVNSVSGTKRYWVWRVINIASGSPGLQGPVVLTGDWTNNVPPPAPGGSGAAIDSGDARVLQVSAISDRLFVVNSTSCQFGLSTSPVESCARLIRIFVGNSNTGVFAATLEQQTVLGGGTNWFYFYPSVAVNNAGTAASAFNAVKTGGHMSVAWATKAYSSSSYAGMGTFLAEGTCLRDATYQASAGRNHYRAGDYSGAAADPDGTRIWVAGERSVQIGGIGCGWQTWIGAITP